MEAPDCFGKPTCHIIKHSKNDKTFNEKTAETRKICISRGRGT